MKLEERLFYGERDSNLSRVQHDLDGGGQDLALMSKSFATSHRILSGGEYRKDTKQATIFKSAN